MRQCTASSPASTDRRTFSPAAPQRIAVTKPQTAIAHSAMALLAGWGCCPRHSPTALPWPHRVPWDHGRLQLAPRLVKLAATAGSSPEPSGERSVSSSSTKTASGSGGDGGQLQPKPQAKYHRLAVSGPGGAPSKPRRWHKVTYMMPSQSTGTLDTLPTAAAQPGTPSTILGQGSPASNNRNDGNDGRDVRDRTTAGGRKERQQQQQQQEQQERRPSSFRQQQPQRGKPRGGSQEIRTASVRNRSTTDNVYDDISDEEEDEQDEDGELLELSEEELEAMVFASAGIEVSAAAGVAGSAPATGKQQRRGGSKGGGGNGASAAAGRQSAAEAVAAAGLPKEVEAFVLAAVKSGSISGDGDNLADQLRQLRETVAVIVDAAAKDRGDSSDSATAVNTLIEASVTAVGDLLNCGPEAAVSVLINYPRYAGMLAVGDGGEGLERLRSFGGMLKLDLAEARDIVRRNPALLLAPYEPLRQKLTALANATGLSMAQATAMVTTYMFPEL